MADMGRWGFGNWTGIPINTNAHDPTLEEVRTVQDSLCYLESANFWVLRRDIQEYMLERKYSPLWFIRMANKFIMELREIEARGTGWASTVRVLHEIDADGDAKLTVDEISAYVRSHGGKPEHLAATVKCRAAAFGTWMLRYDGDPKPIPRPAGYVHGDIVPEFLFPECNKRKLT